MRHDYTGLKKEDGLLHGAWPKKRGAAANNLGTLLFEYQHVMLTEMGSPIQEDIIALITER